MATLKNSIINRILKCLDHGSFIIEDFDCQFESNSSELARITFKALPKYIFVLSENYSSNPFGLTLENFSRGSSNKIISTTKIPGSYKNYEETTHENIDLAIDSVSAWVENIVDDLTNSRLLLSPAIDELSEDFQNSIDENIEDPESYFEEDEKNEMRSKLDKIHERVVELEKKMDLTPEETQKIEKVIKQSKSDLKLYPKGVWYKTTGTKLRKVLKEIMASKEVRDALSDVVKKWILNV